MRCILMGAAIVLSLLMANSQAAPTLVEIWGGNGCTTLSGAGSGTSSASGPINSGVVGNHLAMVIATDSAAGTVTISDNLGAGGLVYPLAHSNSQTTSGNSVRMFVYVTRINVAGVTQINAAISGGTSGKEICLIGEEFSGMSPTAPFVERTGSAFAATTADPYAVSLSQTTTSADQLLLASFARFNYPGGSGVQPYPLHAQVFSGTNAELSLDIGSGPALSAGVIYTRQFDPNSATPFAGIAVSLLPPPPPSPLIFNNGFE